MGNFFALAKSFLVIFIGQVIIGAAEGPPQAKHRHLTATRELLCNYELWHLSSDSPSEPYKVPAGALIQIFFSTGIWITVFLFDAVMDTWNWGQNRSWHCAHECHLVAIPVSVESKMPIISTSVNWKHMKNMFCSDLGTRKISSTTHRSPYQFSCIWSTLSVSAERHLWHHGPTQAAFLVYLDVIQDFPVGVAVLTLNDSVKAWAWMDGH